MAERGPNVFQHLISNKYVFKSLFYIYHVVFIHRTFFLYFKIKDKNGIKSSKMGKKTPPLLAIFSKSTKQPMTCRKTLIFIKWFHISYKYFIFQYCTLYVRRDDFHDSQTCYKISKMAIFAKKTPPFCQCSQHYYRIYAK